MNRYPLTFALCILVPVIVSITHQKNRETRGAGIGIEEGIEEVAQKKTLKRSFKVEPFHDITQRNSNHTQSNPESVSQLRVSGVLSLFEPLDESIRRTSHESEEHSMKAVLSRAPIRINWESLQDIRNRGSGILEIDTGSGRLIAEVRLVISNWGGGYSLSGNIVGDPLSVFIATAHEDALVASITTEKGIREHFAIAMNSAGVHEIQRIDPNQVPACEGVLSPPGAQSSEEPELVKDAENQVPVVGADEVPDGDNKTTVDIMVAYTDAAKNDRGEESAMIAAANQAVNWTNVAFENSGVELSYRLVQVKQVAYSESGNINTDLENIQNKNFMPEIHDLRDACGADIVSLWTNSDYGGLGYLGGLNQWTGGRYAFNVCSSSTRFGSSNIFGVFAHECGHNLGCGHARLQDEEPGPSATFPDYGAGWRWRTNGMLIRSIMAYQPGERVPYFSNPDVKHNGAPTGTVTDNNARVLRAMMSQVENYRRELNYSYVVDGDTVTITDCDKSASGFLLIPERIEGKLVTKIGDSAFRDCKELTRIRIPNSLTTIESSAFYGCTSLISITIPDNVTKIEDKVFYICKSLTSIKVGKNNIKYTDQNGVLFNKDKTLLIAYPIGKTLPNYTIPDDVINVGEGAFRSCSNLNSVTIGKSVVNIGSNAFRFCTSLTKITIPKNVINIGSRAFRASANLKSISFLGDAPLMGISVFDLISAEAEIFVTSSAVGFPQTFGGVHVVVESTVPYVYEVFENNVVITDCDESALGALMIPEIIEGKPVTAIGNSAFRNCTGLTGINIPSTVNRIGSQAFRACISLSSISLSSNVSSIEDRAFFACTSLRSINVSPNNLNYCDLNGVLFNKGKTILISYPAAKEITHYTIPGTVSSIEEGAFLFCDKVKNIIISEGVTTVGNFAFYGCTNLMEVTLSAKVSTIGVMAFSECTSLKSVTIPQEVTNIGSQAFRACASLTSITFLGKAPSMGIGVFELLHSQAKIFVSLDALSFANTFEGLPVIVDSDGDNWQDETETIFNSSPLDSNSTPSFKVEITQVGPSEIELLFPGENDVSYTIQASVDMDNWISIQKLIIGQGSVVKERIKIFGGNEYFRVVKEGL